MQINMTNVRGTTTTFVMDNPNGINCGQSMTFTIHVKYVSDYISGGTVFVIDNDTKEILGQADNSTGITDITISMVSGNLQGGIPGEDGSEYFFGDRNVFALFSGVSNIWKSSYSATQRCIVQKSISNIISDGYNSHTQSAATDGYFQFNLTQSLGSFNFIDGIVDFKLYTDNLSFVNLQSFSLHLTNQGHAIARIPAGTMTAGKRYYLAAFYHGNGCITPCNTDYGIAGFYIDAT
jgi:hypothetical protein